MDKDELVELGQELDLDVSEDMLKEEVYEVLKKAKYGNFPFPEPDEEGEVEEDEEEEESEPEEEPEEVKEEMVFWADGEKLIIDVQGIVVHGEDQKKVFLNSGETTVVSPERFEELTYTK